MISPLPPSRFHFPDPLHADPEENGLIATGADLTPSTLLEAYQHGLFPWFNAEDPICWWSPAPRCVIYPAQFKPSTSLLRQCKKNHYTLTLNRAFAQVIHACAGVRAYTAETWIHQSIEQGYCGLHEHGLAHSIEVWENDPVTGTPTATLVGGLYGVKLAGAFFGESMFSHRTDVSKMAFFLLMVLCEASRIEWADCQLPNPHLMSLGAVEVERRTFLQSMLPTALRQPECDWSVLKTLQIPSSKLLERPALIAKVQTVLFNSEHQSQ